MKQFIEELEKSKQLEDHQEKCPEAESLYKHVREKITNSVGKRALFFDKGEKETRVVRIESVNKYFVVVSYSQYSVEYQNKSKVCISFSSILCKDCRLEVEP